MVSRSLAESRLYINTDEVSGEIVGKFKESTGKHIRTKTHKEAIHQCVQLQITLWLKRFARFMLLFSDSHTNTHKGGGKSLHVVITGIREVSLQ